MNTKKRFRELPEVSVIIPVYRVEDYINQCVDSVLSQSFQNIEIILVDDGSTDNCGAICDDYIEVDERIKVIHKSNGGLSDARNAGLNLAEGKYIYFLDSDDWIDEKLLERVINYMRKGYDLVAFNSYWAETGGNFEKVSHLSDSFEINDDLSRNEFYLGTFLLSKIGWSAWDRIFKRSIIEDNGIRFADNNKIFLEDLYFSCCYCAYAKNILSLNDRLLYYRQRENSILSTEKSKENFNRINELGKELLRYYTYMNCSSLLEVFSQIYFKIFYNLLTSTKKTHEVGLKGMRDLVLNDISDKAFFLNQMKDLLSQRCVSAKAKEKKNLSEMKIYARYFINGNVTEFKIRKKLNDIL